MTIEKPHLQNQKVFIFNNVVPQQKRIALSQMIDKLGGISLPSENEYTSYVTHVIVLDEELKIICPKVLGCLASGKYVVTCNYIYKSKKSKTFLDELDFTPIGKS